MLRSIFVLCAFVVGGVASVHSAFGALLFYIWFALFRPQEWLWIDITGYRPSLIIGLTLVVRSAISGVLPNLTHPLSIGSVLFLTCALIAQAGAVNQAVGWDRFDFLWKLVLVMLLADFVDQHARASARPHGRHRRFIRVLSRPRPASIPSWREGATVHGGPRRGVHRQQRVRDRRAC